MSLQQGLIIEPRPCPFCGGVELELRAVVFRQWNIHCLNSDCRCKGPDGKTAEQAVLRWNNVNQNAITKREDISQMQQEYQDPTTTDQIWKAARVLRTFTVKQMTRVTDLNRETVAKYLYLLEKNDYLRIEGQKSKPGAPNVYRCIKPKEVVAPGWVELQLTDEEYQRYKKDKQTLNWQKIKATA